jgi:hypothetical protein
MAGVFTKNIVGPALFVLMSGCTAVLGIHSAELVDDTGGWGTSSGTASSTGTGHPSNNDPVCSIDPSPACSECLANSCRLAVDSCLAKTNCRAALNDYAKCLDDACEDKKDCAEPIGLASQTLSDCIVRTCAPQCGKSRAVSQCELYCGCMQSICDNFSTLGTTFADCIARCGTLTAHDADCRSNHCEFAAVSTDPIRHCDHAVGGNGSPGSTTSPPLCTSQHAPNACFGKKESGFPCLLAKECCSGKCEGEMCF